MKKDEKYKRIGWLTSFLVQFGLLLLFYFLVAWKEPFPPIPTYGIELDFGLEQTGSGEVSDTASEEAPIEETEQVEEITPDEVIEEVVENDLQEEVVEETEEVNDLPVEEAVYEDEDSPDVVEENQVSEEIPEVAPVVEDTIEEIEDAEESTAEEPQEPVEEVVEDEIIETEALMPSSDEPQTEEQSQGNTEGDGDEGKEEGIIDGRAIYGSQGSAKGASLQMTGWKWDIKPNPDEKSDEVGKIVYKITINDEGEFVRIDLVSRTVSPNIERIYRQSIERLSFTKTNDYQPAPTSTGFVTFIIKSK
ncbi:MAG: hypothetical protein JXR03_12940 [Cyclobacteriaceae bacterium]